MGLERNALQKENRVESLPAGEKAPEVRAETDKGGLIKGVPVRRPKEDDSDQSGSPVRQIESQTAKNGERLSKPEGRDAVQEPRNPETHGAERPRVGQHEGQVATVVNGREKDRPVSTNGTVVVNQIPAQLPATAAPTKTGKPEEARKPPPIQAVEGTPSPISKPTVASAENQRNAAAADPKAPPSIRKRRPHGHFELDFGAVTLIAVVALLGTVGSLLFCFYRRPSSPDYEQEERLLIVYE
jgi:hypothetical protein